MKMDQLTSLRNGKSFSIFDILLLPYLTFLWPFSLIKVIPVNGGVYQNLI